MLEDDSRCREWHTAAYNPFARGFQSSPGALEGWLWNVSQEAADRYIQECLPGGDPYFHSKLTCREGKVQLRSRANR